MRYFINTGDSEALVDGAKKAIVQLQVLKIALLDSKADNDKINSTLVQLENQFKCIQVMIEKHTSSWVDIRSLAVVTDAKSLLDFIVKMCDTIKHPSHAKIIALLKTTDDTAINKSN